MCVAAVSGQPPARLEYGSEQAFGALTSGAVMRIHIQPNKEEATAHATRLARCTPFDAKIGPDERGGEEFYEERERAALVRTQGKLRASEPRTRIGRWPTRWVERAASRQRLSLPGQVLHVAPRDG